MGMKLNFKFESWENFTKVLPVIFFFITSKFEIEFHSHKKVVSPKLENSAHLFIVNFKCAKLQKK